MSLESLFMCTAGSCLNYIDLLSWSASVQSFLHSKNRRSSPLDDQKGRWPAPVMSDEAAFLHINDWLC